MYKKGSPEYITLFPRGRRPFNTGSQTTRLEAVITLSGSLTGITALAAVKTQVDAYLAIFETAYNLQKTDISTTKMLKSTLEEVWLNACEALYYVTAALMQEYNNNTALVANFIPFDMLSKAPQKEFTGKLKEEEQKAIVTRTLKPTDKIDLTNNSLVATVSWYWAETKEGIVPPGTTPYLLGPGLKARVDSAALGAIGNRHLIVRNMSAIAEGEWDVELP